MQSLLESTTSSPKFAPGPSPTPSRSIQVAACVLIITLSLYITIFLLPSFSETDMIPDRTAKPSSSSSFIKTKNTIQNINELHDHSSSSSSYSSEQKRTSKKSSPLIRSNSNNAIIEPWGYNKNRNIPRWKAIKASIEKDMIKLRQRENDHQQQQQQPQRFTLVDYGSDQGFFSISAAHEFQKDGIFVVSVEMGGVGGEIWKKKDSISEGSNDVLSIQEQKVAKYVTNHEASDAPAFMICQTKISPKMFFDLQAHHQKHRYQFVLSVFHWFDLPTRKDFEKALVTLFKNSQSTFIELPTIGDRSALIRKQVGWANFEKWYDGRSDIKEIILDAAKNENFPVTVEKIVSVPWLKWTRDMYRVDWDLSSENDEHSVLSSVMKFTCKTRREEIYGCNPKRVKLQECVDI